MLIRAQKIESLILQRLDVVKGSEVAAAIHVDESTITNLKYPDKVKINFRSISMLLAVLGLKVVPEKWVCVDAEEYEHLSYFAEKYFTDKRKDRLQNESDDSS